MEKVSFDTWYTSGHALLGAVLNALQQAGCRHRFSKGLSTASSDSKCTKALTFGNVCYALQGATKAH